MIDFDNRTSLSIYFGLEPKIVVNSITDVLAGKCDMFEATIPLRSGLDLIPCTIDLSIPEGKIGREFMLKNQLLTVARG
jgi:ATPases involved in chromosome partitioning